MSKNSRNANAPSRLGRGLSSLIHAPAPAAESPEPVAFEQPAQPDYAPQRPAMPVDPALISTQPLKVRLDKIAPNPHQPRRTFEPDALAELAASIRRHGVLQPIMVVRAPGLDGQAPFVLIAGERRLRAAKLAGLEAIPCMVHNASDQQMLEWSLIENIQRSDLNPIERAQAYRNYMDRFSLTQAQVAERTGESRAGVANYLRTLDLCDEVQAMLLSGDLTFGHARALAGLAGKSELQQKLANRIVEGMMSVRQAEQLVAAVRDGSPSDDAPAKKDGRTKPPYVLDLESQLTRAIGTRVVIRPGRAKNTGRIVIDYYSLDEFERIAGSLGFKAED